MGLFDDKKSNQQYGQVSYQNAEYSNSNVNVDVQNNADAKKSNRPKKNGLSTDTTFLQDLIKLLFKVAIIGLSFVLLFTFIFGAFRYSDSSMQPSVKDGDMIITYRWDKRYSANDLVVFWYNDQACIGRVMATSGQSVDIKGGTVVVDGVATGGSKSQGETTQVEDGVDFPLTVEQGEVFVLGDNRTGAIDSRTFGCVNIDQSEGKVIGLFRHRGL